MRIVPLALTLAFATTGCASMFINGGDLVSDDLAPKATRHFKISSCTNLVDNSSIPPPSATYHVVDYKGQPALFERSPDGTGTAITNHWEAADGTHYLTWVQSNGWEFVIPREAGKDGQRLVHAPLAKTEEGGVTKPTSKPTASCVLSPQ